jgi:cell division protein FtsZ
MEFFDEQGKVGAVIKVIGVGGAGVNAVNNMIVSGLEGVQFYAANTDAQALRSSLAPNKIRLGNEITKGLGAGADPEIGYAAARESAEEIRSVLDGADMVFITAGMGGGTGTLASSVIAEIARDLGCLTVAVVTKPFRFEGRRREKNAERGIEQLTREVDTLIKIPNNRLLSVAGRNTTVVDAFKKADDILFQAVKGISDLIIYEGLVNVDFSDVRTVMSEMGMAMMGTGEATGENRAVEAAERAISSPLLDDMTIQGARGVLINVTASPDVTLQEVNEANEMVHAAAHEDANIIWGMVIDPSFENRVRVTVIATGFGEYGTGYSTIPSSSPKVAGRIDTGRIDNSFSESYDLPAYARRSQERTNSEATNNVSTNSNQPSNPNNGEVVKLKKVASMGGEVPSEEGKKYDIPLFLRKMDR